MTEFSTEDKTEEKFEGPGVPERMHDGMEVGEIFKYPFQDKEWIKKVAVMGAINLIPIVGQINLLGWMRDCYDFKKRDQSTLPEAGFQHINRGVPFFLALLIPYGAVFAANIVAAIVPTRILSFLFGSVAGLFGLAVSVLVPAVMYIFVRDADTKAALRIDKLRTVVLGSGVVPYIMLVLCCLVASFIGGIGYSFLFFGSIVTMPIAAAIAGAALGEFTREMAEAEKEQG